MSILDLNIDDAEEFHPLPPGEQQLMIDSMELKKSKNGAPMLQIVLKSRDDEMASRVYHYILIPTQDDDPAQNNMRKLNLKRFCEAVGVDTQFMSEAIDTAFQSLEAGLSGEEPFETLVGQDVWAILALEEYEGEERAKVKRFVKAE